MVERVLERKREPEPKQTMYDRLIRIQNEDSVPASPYLPSCSTFT